MIDDVYKTKFANGSAQNDAPARDTIKLSRKSEAKTTVKKEQEKKKGGCCK